MAIVKIEGTNLCRDTKTMALFNRDKNGLEDYKNKRKMMATQAAEINKIKTEINGIKEEMQDIKSLILRLLDKGSNG